MNFEDIIPNRVAYAEGFLPRLFATRLMGQLIEECSWSQERLKVRGGVEVPFPRLVAWQGDPGITYRYSGVDHLPAEWTPRCHRCARPAQGGVPGYLNQRVPAELVPDGQRLDRPTQ